MLPSPPVRRLWLVIAVLATLASPAWAQRKKLSLEDLTAEPPLSGRPITGLAWLPDGRHFSYVVRQGSGEDAAAELVLEETRTGQKTVFTAQSLMLPAEPADKTDVEPGVERQLARTGKARLEGYRWSPDGKTVLLSGNNDIWLFQIADKSWKRLTRNADPEEFPSFSPDGRRVAFVRKHDLYVLEVATGKEARLTTDGAEHVFNGRLDWVYEEELANRSGRSYEWSPDGAAIAYLKLDETRVAAYPIVDFLKVPAAVTWQRYPKAGTPNSLVSFHVVGIDGSPRGDVKLEGDVYVVPAFSWTPDSASVSYRVLNREQNREEVRLFTPASRTSRTLLVEEDPYWVNTYEPPQFLPGGRYLWKSERDGWAHLYVGEIAGGAPPRAITRGQWIVDKVIGVDRKKGLVYFTATEENVRRRPIYRVALDGSGFTKLTREPGTHAAELSPDGEMLLDTYSAVSRPPALSLLDATGKPVRSVEQPDGRLAGYELATIDEVEIAAEDGAKLMARLVKPADFDPAKKYPVIVFVYGGPHSQVVRDAWNATPLFDHYLASKGFLVWSLDNRGSFGRGHAWEAAVFKDMGRRELADQLAGVRHLKSLPFVDPARVGIWGWSYGGYLTLYALTNAPDVWKCGVAGAPVTHWKFYDTIYTERYMRTPKDNPAGYEASAPLSRAKELKAKLLLIHGTADDNVHMQNTMAFLDALTKAGKLYQLELQPGQKHGFRGREAINFRHATIAKFFENNL